MAADLAASMERELLQELANSGSVESSVELATQKGWDHARLASIIRSLHGAQMVAPEERERSGWALTSEAKSYIERGSSEVLVFAAVPAEGGALLEDLKKSVPSAIWDVGYKQAMQQKWISIEKGEQTKVVRKAAEVEDVVRGQLLEIQQGADLEKKITDALKKRKLITQFKEKSYKLLKGPEFALERKKEATDLTLDMLKNGTWTDQTFKQYNYNAQGPNVGSGHLHPLLKVRTQFRKIFMELGFFEMPTNNFVESSFWNFDALFQPQQHPARDAHDTFFLTEPSRSTTFPEEYLERVRKTHETGGFGSFGYGYSWKRSEAEKNLLRTHTTAVSSKMLYKLAQEGFKAVKYFSIDRVFRNESVDKTHLAEFHQIEGVVCDRGMTLGHLIGVIELFFKRLGMPHLRFKPAYNPYTEPSMEIFSYHEGLKKWVEVGNSGVFRPEMLRPMGLPEDVSVIAWGLSLERPTMILYGIDNIRDLFGHKVDLDMIKSNPICRLGL